MEKAAISLLVVYLINADISGAFAYDYVFQFVSGLAIGLKRKELAEAKPLLSDYFGSYALVRWRRSCGDSGTLPRPLTRPWRRASGSIRSLLPHGASRTE